MTFGTIVAYLGIGVYAGTIAGIGIVLLFATLLILYLKMLEEKELTERFGETYLAYKREVPFVLVHNDYSEFMENVSAQVTLVDANNVFIASQVALLPLNILPPNTSMPLAVFYPPDIPIDAKPQVQILTAFRLLPNDERYIPATINNTLVQVNADGHSAQVGGLVLSQSQTSVANQVWVAGTAYDEDGRVVGVRRWEASGSLNPGASLPFEFLISSIGGEIAKVEFSVEARP